MPQILLVVPTATYRAHDFVRAARDLGVDVVIASDGDLALAGESVIRSIEADLGSPDAGTQIASQVNDLAIDAVLGVDDGSIEAAADAARALGVAHLDPDAVGATRDKAVMRTLLSAADVRQPAFHVVSDVDAAIGAAAELGYPVVLKPRSLSASRGVIRADDDADLIRIWERVSAIDATGGGDGTLLVEAFVAGPEVAVEALASPDGVEILAVFDKPDPLDGPFFEETIYTTPSRHGAGADIEAVVSAAVRALGIDRGPVHAELRLGSDGPVAIEVAARSIGGLCSRALEFGMLRGSLEEQIIRSTLGMTRRGMQRSGRATGVMMLPIPAEGVLVGVAHSEAIAEVEGIRGLEITLTNGRWVRPLPEGDRYLGFLFAEGETPADVEASLREAHGLLDVRIDPDGTPTGGLDDC